MSNNIHRRTFLKTLSLSSISLLPGSDVLSGLIAYPPVVNRKNVSSETFVDYACDINEFGSMLYLQCYFINVSYDKTKKALRQLYIQKPVSNGAKQDNDDPETSIIHPRTYMIVRTPQQHISEEYFDVPTLFSNLTGNKKVYARTAISGYSFLVFEINFDALPLTDNEKLFNVNTSTILNWNASWFNLVITDKPKASIFEVTKSGSADKFINNYPLSHDESGTFDRNRFPQYNYIRLTNDAHPANNTPANRAQHYLVSNASPVTAIEAPYRLIISPSLPDRTAYEFFWSFSRRTSINPDIPTTDDVEIWSATLTIRRRKPLVLGSIPKDSASEKTTIPESNGISQMELMILGAPDTKDKVDNDDAEDQRCLFKRLPCASDRIDLAWLYLHSRVAARTESLSFSSLGLSANINFRNNKFDKNLIPLLDWNQEISYGRDQHAVVSRIMVEATFGCKMLHIKTTNRETFNDQALLVYREFLKPLDPDKDFSQYNIGNTNEYKDTNSKFKQPFKRIAFKDMKAVEILPVSKLDAKRKVYRILSNEEAKKRCDCSNVENNQQVIAFWPVTLDGKELRWEMLYYDWHSDDDQSTMAPDKQSTHGFFMLSAELANSPDYQFNYLAGDQRISFSELSAQKMAVNVGGSFEVFKQTLKANIAVISNTNDKNVWAEILKKSEDFDLQITDRYRDFLEDAFARGEALVRSRAQDIVDQAIEHWNIFKRRALNAGKEFLTVVDRLRLFAQAMQETLSAPFTDFGFPGSGSIEYDRLKAAFDRLKAIFDNIRTTMDGLKSQVVSDINTNYQNAIARFNDYKVQVQTLKRSVESSFGDNYVLIVFQKVDSGYRTIIERFHTCFALVDAFDGNLESLGVENAFAIFLAALPPQYANAIRGELAVVVNNIRAAALEIEHVEENLKSKAELFKSKVGYAVSYVEDELNKLKEAAKTKYKEKWEEEYNKMRKQYHELVNKPVSALQTEYILFRNNFRHFEREFKSTVNDVPKQVVRVFHFYDEYSCFPQMHTAKVCVQAINDLVQQEIPVKIKYAAAYVENQVDNLVFQTQNNAAKVFAELKSDGGELLKAATRLVSSDMPGVNIEVAKDFLTYMKDRDLSKEVGDLLTNTLATAEESVKDTLQAVKDELSQPIRQFEGALKEFQDSIKEAKNNVVLMSKQAVAMYHDTVNEVKNEIELRRAQAKAYFQSLEAKILGAIHIRDIIGDDAMLPRIDTRGKKVYYTFITDKLMAPSINGLFSFTPSYKGAKANLAIHFEKSLVDKNYTAYTRLSNFTAGVFSDRIVIGFNKLELVSNASVKNKVSVDIGDVHFTKELAFIEALSKNIKLPGTGLTLSIHPKDISIDFAYALPDISGGAFNFFNVKFHVGVKIAIPIGPNHAADPIVAAFGINAPDDKFVLGVGIWGGRGHAVLETTPKYIRKVDIGMDYGGLLALNLGIAKGQAYLMAGVRYVYERNEFGKSRMELYALVTCGGSVTVFGFITISVVFLLCLKYQQSDDASSLYGIASVTYSVEIGFFKKSFTLSFSKKLAGSDSTSGGTYGYNNKTRRPGIPNDQLQDAVWVEDDAAYETPDFYYFAKNGNDTEDRDEYYYANLPLRERFTRPESRLMFSIYDFQKK